MPPHTLEQLFARYREQGDVDALAALFDRVAPELSRIAVYLGGDRSRAEDLVQDTFLAAIERQDAFCDQGKLLPWLLGILANKARRLRRDAARVPPPAKAEAGSDADPAASLQGRELREHLVAGLERLPDSQRPVLRLHLLEGLGAKSIAQALDRPEGTVRSQISRGLDTLRRLLPPGLATMGVAAAAAPAAMAQVRQAVLAHAIARSTIGATVATHLSSKATASWSALLMKTKIAIAAAAGCLILVLVSLRSQWWSGLLPGSLPASLPAAQEDAAHDPPAAEGSAKRIEPGRTPLSDPARVPAASGLPVRVVFAEDDRPAAGATILLPLPPDRQQELMRTSPEAITRIQQGFDVLYGWAGRCILSAADGTATLPRDAAGQSVVATLDGRYAEIRLPTEHDFEWMETGSPLPETLLRLEPDLSVAVQTLDPDGHPRSGVPIVLGQLTDSGHWHLRYVGDTAGEPALLNVRHLQVRKRWGNLVTGGDRRCSIAIDLPGLRGAATEIDLDDLPTRPLRLRLPPTGKLVVQFLDDNGDPCRPIGNGLSAEPRLEIEDIGSERALERVPTARLIDAQGRCVFERVALGQRYRLRSHDLDLSREVDGPQATSATVTVRLQIGVASHPVTVRGRALDADGQPAAGRYLSPLVYGSGTRQHGIPGIIVTAPDGTFRFGLPEAWASRRLTELVLEERVAGTGPGRERVTGQVARSRPEFTLRPGQNEFGDHHLALVPMLVAGRIEGREEGVPGYPELYVQEARPPWRRIAALVVWPSPDRFEIRAPIVPGGQRLRLCADDRKSVQPDPVHFQPGAHDLVVRFETGGRAQITVEVPGGIAPPSSGWMHVRLVPVDGRTSSETPAPHHGGALQRVQGSYRYRYSGIRPGSYRVEVFCFGFYRPVHVVDGVQVDAGRLTHDPRLRIDLRDVLHAGTLHLQPAVQHGRLIPLGVDAPTRAELDRDDAWWRRHAIKFKGDKVTFLAPTPGFDAILVASGFRTRWIHDIGRQTNIRLEPAPRFRFRVTGDPGAIGPGVGLRLDADPSQGAWARSPSRGSYDHHVARDVPLGPDGTATAEDLLAGRWRVNVLLSIDGRQRAVLDEPITIDIPADADGGEILIEIPAGSLAAARARAPRKR